MIAANGREPEWNQEVSKFAREERARKNITQVSDNIISTPHWLISAKTAQIENEGWLPRESNWRGYIWTATVAGRVN